MQLAARLRWVIEAGASATIKIRKVCRANVQEKQTKEIKQQRKKKKKTRQEKYQMKKSCICSDKKKIHKYESNHAELLTNLR